MDHVAKFTARRTGLWVRRADGAALISGLTIARFFLVLLLVMVLT